ncbi:MAG: VIT domain-containing protein [Verrucomicrobiota bacterium]
MNTLPTLARTALVAFALLSLTFETHAALPRKDLKQEPWIAGRMDARPMDSESSNPEGWILPLKRTDVQLRINAGLVEAEVSQRFTNDTDHRLEAVYKFPLPSEATVTDMEVRIGDRLIRSMVQRKAEARETYETAKREGKATALLEQNRPNMFTVSVANFAPGETAVTRLTYLEKAEFRKGAYLVNFPMTIGPRYLPKDSASIEVAEVSNPVLPPWIDSEHRLSLAAEIRGIPADVVTSPTHRLKTNVNGDVTTISLAQLLNVPDKDFSMEIRLRESETPKVSVVRSEIGEDHFKLVSVFPPDHALAESTPRMPRDVIFLIDTSGSMDGDSIVQARKGLTECLKMLTADDEFNIVRFSDEFSSFRDAPVPVKKGNLKAAREYIETLEADGGTEMQAALDHVLTMPNRQEAMKMVIFLTDGAVGNENTLFRLLDQKLQDRRLFTFGIGSAPNEYLMRKMGELGHGQARFIRSEENVGEVMSDFFKTVAAPVLTDVKLQWLDANDAPVRLETFPKVCPDVFHERPLQVVAKSTADSSPQSLEIRGKIGGESVTYRFDLNKAVSTGAGSIDKLFGRAHIDELMFLQIRSDQSEYNKLGEEIAQVSLDHQLVSEYTSRVAVEERIVRQPDGELVSVPVPNEFPNGWNADQFFGTATNETLRLAIAAALLLFAILIGFVRRPENSSVS